MAYDASLMCGQTQMAAPATYTTIASSDHIWATTSLRKRMEAVMIRAAQPIQAQGQTRPSGWEPVSPFPGYHRKRGRKRRKT